MSRLSRYSPEVRERAVRLVREHGAEHPSEWAAIESIAGKLGCTAETLRKWVRQAERDTGLRGGLTTAERQRTMELEREVRELKRINEILRKASAYFAQAELDRRGVSRLLAPREWGAHALDHLADYVEIPHLLESVDRIFAPLFHRTVSHSSAEVDGLGRREATKVISDPERASHQCPMS